jgi:ATP-dependent DNA helicase DinG
VWSEARRARDVESGLGALRDGLAALGASLEPHAERSPDLAQCHARCAELEHKLREFEDHERDDQLQWLETFTQSFVLNVTPIDIGPTLGELMARRNAALVFTSATLAVGEDFSHFIARAGVVDPRTARWESPFDFQRQALLYLPRGLPEPAAPGYTQAVVTAAIPVLRASGGRAFMLFTSHRALQIAAAALREQVEFPLYIQGALPRTRLLEEFRASGNGVLLGTSSFWEGVDVRGDALSVVIIDKLPFAAPDEPLVRARAEVLRARGLNPFLDDQLPQAVIALKQGVGRLIRDANDRGVLMLCDPRLTSKPYGKKFLDALPAAPTTREVADAVEFFARRPAPSLADLEL